MFFSSRKKKSDEQLMVLIKNGNHRAFENLYERYSRRIKSFFYRMLWSDNEMSEDYVHDLFAKIIERPELFKDGMSFQPWIFQVASNMCKNAYRRRAFEQEYLNQLDTDGVQISNPGKNLDNEIILENIHLNLGKMDEEKRELFLLRYQQELSIKELAEIFETTEGTIKSRLFYVRKALLKNMSEEQILHKNEK